MPRRMSSVPGVFINATGWTGKCLPTTAGTESIHAEIADSQVRHWTKAEIRKAEKSGYFTDLTKRAMRNTRLGLLGLVLWGLYTSQKARQEPLTKPRPRVRRVK